MHRSAGRPWLAVPSLTRDQEGWLFGTIGVVADLPDRSWNAPWQAWLGLTYVSLVSMFLGFVFWYRGLALGGTARVGQAQLAQPVLTLLWSALLLGERVGPAEIVTGAVVVASVALTRRFRAPSPPSPAP